jgi:hypothetical protein
MSKPTFSRISGEPLETGPEPHWWEWRKRRERAEERVVETLEEFKEAVDDFTAIVEEAPWRPTIDVEIGGDEG